MWKVGLRSQREMGNDPPSPRNKSIGYVINPLRPNFFFRPFSGHSLR